MLVQREVAAVRGAVRAALDPTAPPYAGGVDDREFLAEAQVQRVVEVLADSDLPASLLAPLVDQRDHTRLLVLHQIREMNRVADLLEGIDWLSIKGPLLAVQSAGDFVARGYGDIDIVVAPASVTEAFARLSGAGWALEEEYPRPGPSWAWRHVLATYYEIPLTNRRSAVDLHWALSPTRGPLPSFQEAWADRATVRLAGRDWATLSLPDAFRHSCAHAAKDSWLWLRSLVDIYRLAADPALWVRLPPRLRSTELTTLRVVSDRIGLPAAVPQRVVDAVAGVPKRRLASIERKQAQRRSGGAGAWTTQALLGVRLREGRRPADVARTLWSGALPASALADLHSERAVVAVPMALGRRARQLGRRLGVK